MVLPLLVTLAGCAYYNTFYLAKKNYREGMKAQERSLTDAPSQEAIGKYEVVIRQCTKVLKDYSKSKYVDDATYLLGAALYGKGDYVNAIKRFSEFPTKYPKSPFLADARFMEGLSHYRRKEYVTADSIFHEVDQRFEKFPRRWELYYYAGETQAQLRNFAGAATWYGEALKSADNRRQKAMSLRRSGDVYLEADRPDTAATLYAKCLEVEERGPQRVEVALARGDALRRVGRYQEALDFLKEWRIYAAAESKEGDLLLLTYDVMSQLGRVNEALQGYRGLVEKFPRTSVAYEAQFQIGYLYETQLQDLEAAAREYDKLKGQPTSEFQSQAARRSQSLATLKQYRTAMASDTTQARAKAAFLLAELYYFQLEKTDSALTQYRLVEEQFPRSVFAPKSAYARLWITAFDRQDTLGTLALTDSMAERYRGTRFAESALYLWKRWSGRTDERTALLESLLANPDTSRMAAFEPEPDLKLAPLPADSAAMAAQLLASWADSVRLDSMRTAAEKFRNEYMLEMGKSPAPQGPAPNSQLQTPPGAQAQTPGNQPKPEPPAAATVAPVRPDSTQATDEEDEEEEDEVGDDGAGP